MKSKAIQMQSAGSNDILLLIGVIAASLAIAVIYQEYQLPLNSINLVWEGIASVSG